MDILLLAMRLLLVILLYAFLGAVLFTLWRDLRQTAVSRETDRSKGELIVLHAPEDEDGAPTVGTVFPLQPVTSIGRSPNNTIVISDTYTSGHHALLTWREDQWWLEDRNSRNGTLLNDTRISAPTVVSAGDVIGVGRIRLKLAVSY